MPFAPPLLLYSQVVSAALVTVRSSGSSVVVLLDVPRSSCTWTVEPLGDGGVTELKSEPSTTRTTSPMPVVRSMVALWKDEATVAAACSLPGEKNTVVESSGPG